MTPKTRRKHLLTLVPGSCRELERFRAKWIPVRVKKTRQNKNLEPGSDSIRTEKAPALPAAALGSGARKSASESAEFAAREGAFFAGHHARER
jgi:hypothetical protein